MPSSIESVGSYTVVMAETFAAVGLSSLVPTALIAAAQIAHGALRAGSNTDLTKITETFKSDQGGTNNPLQNAIEVINAVADKVGDLKVLLPKDATIKSEFKFEGKDSISENASAGGMLQVVSVNAGFSEMYSSKSTNLIQMTVHFTSVNVPL